jgi:FSR family fosmidomycin resistance protein-like MFS transporter
MAKSMTADSPLAAAVQTRFNLLGALSFSHFLNDMMLSLIVAIYPLLKGEFHLSLHR